jgi:Spy/CpxP family protein refolding chaperone
MKKTLIAAALLTIALPLFAADLPPGKWWRRPEVVQQLSITDEQQTRLDAIFRSAANNLIDSRAEVEKLQLAIRGELDQAQLNRANLQRLANELSAARGKLFEREILMLADMRGVLTEQQWTKMRAQLDRMEAKGQGGPRPRRPPQ